MRPSSRGGPSGGVVVTGFPSGLIVDPRKPSSARPRSSGFSVWQVPQNAWSRRRARACTRGTSPRPRCRRGTPRARSAASPWRRPRSRRPSALLRRRDQLAGGAALAERLLAERVEDRRGERHGRQGGAGGQYPQELAPAGLRALGLGMSRSFRQVERLTVRRRGGAGPRTLQRSRLPPQQVRHDPRHSRQHVQGTTRAGDSAHTRRGAMLPG